MASRRDFGEQSRPSGPRLSFATPGSAPYKHAIPHGNTTPTNASPSATRPKAAPIPQVATGSHLAEARSRHILRALRRRRSTAQVLPCCCHAGDEEGSASQELGQEESKYIYYVDESSLDDVKSATRVYELEAESRERDARDEARRREDRDRAQQQAHKDAKTYARERQHDADMRRVLERMEALEKSHARERRAAADAETMKTEQGEGDVDEPDAEEDDNKVPGLVDGPDAGEESDGEGGRDAPHGPMPEMPWPPPSPPPPGSRHARGAAHDARGQDHDQDQDHDQIPPRWLASSEPPLRGHDENGGVGQGPGGEHSR